MREGSLGASRGRNRIARSNVTMGQGAHHLGVSLAPATDLSSSAGASCASSLPAAAGVVTTRLAQDFCRSYAGRIAAANVMTRAAMIVRREVAACMSHVGAPWRRPLLAGTDVSAGAVEEGRTAQTRAKSYRDRAAFDQSCSRMVAGARWLDIVRTWDVRKSTADLRVSPSLAAAGFQEMRPAFALALASIGRCDYGHQAG